MRPVTLPVADPWFTAQEVEPGGHLIAEPFCHPLVRANCFLVEGRDRVMLVDSGMGVGALRRFLAPWLTKPLVVVATHAHIDHIGSHHEFAGSEMLIHPSEAAELEHPRPLSGLGFDMFSPALRAEIKAAGFETDGLLVEAVPSPDYDPAHYRLTGARPTGVVDEGDTIDLGDRRFEVLHLPGHSPGGIGLWDASRGTLFAGDTVYDGVLLDTLTGSDIPAYVASMRRLHDLPVTMVHGGHNASFGRERMVTLINTYLRARAG